MLFRSTKKVGTGPEDGTSNSVSRNCGSRHLEHVSNLLGQLLSTDGNACYLLSYIYLNLICDNTMTFADGTTEKAKALLYIKTDVNSLKFEKDAMTIYLDEDDYLSPIFNDGATTPSDTSITWTSDDSSIVSVDSYGKIHANKLGTTWISALLVDQVTPVSVV